MKEISCIIGITFLISGLSMSILKRDTSIFKDFYNLLDNEQKSIYDKIVKERISIYFYGMLFGIALGAYYYYKYPNDSYRLCKFLAIIYIVKLGFYYIYPKRPLMLYSLKNQKQVEAWANIYTEMKSKWIKSIMIGFVGYLLIGLNF
tara:strand:+ start:5607 stop:6047 length:441 start_codon:yes stop_codon:yes gene_type:complete